MRATDALRFGKNTDSCIIHDDIHILVVDLATPARPVTINGPKLPNAFAESCSTGGSPLTQPRAASVSVSERCQNIFQPTLAHPERPSPRRATEGDGRVSINSANNGCHPGAAAAW